MTADVTEKASVRPFDPVSISPLSFWALTNEEREASFKILRDERPVSWHPPIDRALIAPEVDGVWAVTRHEDITYVSKNPELFCSGRGVMIEALPEDVLEAVMSFLAMDGAEHSSARRLISSVFTPRQVAKIKIRSSTRPSQSSTTSSRPRRATSSSRSPTGCRCGRSTK